MLDLFANNIQTTLSSAITSSQTIISVTSASGLPSPSSGQYFVMTFTNGSTNEIVWVTNVSGTSITCIRGQEGTTAQSFPAGAYASCFPTAGTMQNLIQIDQLQSQHYIYADAGGTANAITATVASNLTTLSDGMMFIINAAYANTGAITFNLTLGSTITGAIPVVLSGNIALSAGQIPSAGTQLILIYSSAYSAWILANPSIILTSYAPLNSPAFTGTPTAPTATTGTNTTQLATTAFVQSALGSYAPLYSPALGGVPTAPTATSGTNSTQLATTAFVQSAVASAVTSVVANSGSGNTTFVYSSGGVATISPTHYEVSTGQGASSGVTVNVFLVSGQWQLVLHSNFQSPDANEGTSTQSASIGTGNSISTSVQFVRTGGAGFGRIIYGSEINVSTFTVSTNTSTTLTISAPSLSSGQVYYGGRATLQKIG